VPHYRLYYLDLAGHIVDAADLDCEDDEHALREVERRRDGRAMELWRRAVLLGRFEPLERRALDPAASGGRDAAEV
jgi:hypothetical protein